MMHELGRQLKRRLAESIMNGVPVLKKMDEDEWTTNWDFVELLMKQEFSHRGIGLIEIQAIIDERKYQDKKWGTIKQHPHTILEWVTIMEKELAEAKKAFFQRPADVLMLVEILQVVAVGVACLQQHGTVTREMIKDQSDG